MSPSFHWRNLTFMVCVQPFHWLLFAGVDGNGFGVHVGPLGLYVGGGR